MEDTSEADDVGMTVEGVADGWTTTYEVTQTTCLCMARVLRGCYRFSGCGGTVCSVGRLCSARGAIDREVVDQRGDVGVKYKTTVKYVMLGQCEWTREICARPCV